MFIMPQQTRRSPRVYRRNADINMTNLMDVMMVLLVVFMVAAPLMTSGIALDLPVSYTHLTLPTIRLV